MSCNDLLVKRLWALLSVPLVLAAVLVPAAPAAAAATLSGTLTYSAALGAPPGQLANVYAYDLDSDMVYNGATDASGNWSLAVGSGTYQLKFWAQIGPSVHEQYWGEAEQPWFRYGDTIVVGDGETIDSLDLELQQRSAPFATLVCGGCDDFSVDWIVFNSYVQAFDPAVGDWRLVRSRNSPYSHSYDPLLPGHYRVVISYVERGGPQWGYGTAEFDIGVSTGATVTVEAGWPDTERIGGPDRFTVASAISREAFPEGADTVYIANGLNFPDALGGGPAAFASGGPLLLVTPTQIPADTSVELARLDPDSIVILGDTPSVSAAVASQLTAYAPVHRIAGADRFDTSIKTALHAFPDGVDVLYIATGRNFPDALSAGPAAISRDGTVLIVDGALSEASVELRAALETLAPRRILVVGDALAVSTAFELDLVDLGYTVERVAGVDRWDTSMRIATEAFGNVDEALLAVGTRFPDALAGGVLAGVRGVPLIVSPTNCTTEFGALALTSLLPETVTLLGSTDALAQPATLFRRC
jgi:putative cell wall-binding protein